MQKANHRGNPLAPQWMQSSFDHPFCDVWSQFEMTLTVAAATRSFANELGFSDDSDFIIKAWAFDQAFFSGVRFRDSNGRAIMDNFCDPRDLQGPVPMSIRIPAGGKLYIDAYNATGGSVTGQIIVQGVKRYGRAVSAPVITGAKDPAFVPMFARYSQAPAGWYDEPFTYYLEPALTAGQQKLGQVLRMDTDAAFYWRGTRYSDNGGGGAAKWNWYDPYRKRLTREPVFTNNWFGAGANKPLSSEVVCPRGSVLTYDATEYLAGSVTYYVALDGVKRFPIGMRS